MEQYFNGEKMEQLILVDHPILKHKLGFLRDKKTSSAEFRNIIKEISRFLTYEATRSFEVFEAQVETPMAKAKVERVKGVPIVVSIMRAGNGMLDGILTALPFAQAGHIGIYRDKFIKNTVEYYFKIPNDCKGKKVLLADPLIATGDTVIASVDRLKQYEVGPISCLCVLISKKGLKALTEAHPDVNIFALAIEEEIDEKGYLIPGIGDVGDRLYQI